MEVGLVLGKLFMKAGLVRMRTYVRREIQLNSREIQRATNMSLLELGPTIFGGTEAIIDYLRRHHLLADHCNCSHCGIGMRERPRRDVSDGFSWWCPQCKTRKSIREGSFFSKSRMTLHKWLLMVYWWARNYSLTDAAEEAEINAGTAVDVFQWFREVCSTKLLQTPLVLGGAGVVVQIDESLFRHKPKVQVSFVTAVVWEVTTIIIVAWVYIYIYILYCTVSQRPTSTTRSVGLWNGRYLSSTRIRIYGGCSAKGCYHTATNHSGPHCSWYYNPL